MDTPYLNGGGFKNKPRALMCYICGKEYGTASLQIHIKTCIKRWEIEESKKPKKERRPLPQPPKELSGLLNRLEGGERVNMAELDEYNNIANDKWNEEALVRCEYCNRTFLPERMPVHRKVCTADKPFKPLPPSEKNSKIQTYSEKEPEQDVRSSMSGSFGGSKMGGGGTTSTSTSKPLSKTTVGKSSYPEPENKPPVFKKPKSVMCYICGREYGTASISIHVPQCEKKFILEENKKPPNQRRPVPQPPPEWQTMVKKMQNGEEVDMQTLDYINEKANDKWNEEALVRCENCNRTFLPERMAAHKKVCSKENPFKPLPNNPDNMKSVSQSTTSLASKSTKKSSMDYDNIDYEDSLPTKKGGVMASQTFGKSTVGKTSSMGSSKVNQFENVKSGGFSGGGGMSGGMSSKIGGMGGSKMTNMMDQYEDVDLVPCSICGRKFAADRIDKHTNACQKAKKGEAKHAKKVAQAQKKQAEIEKFIQKEQKYKTSKWKQAHEEFQAMLKYNKKLQHVEKMGGDIRTLEPPPQMQTMKEAMVPCPYCGRNFSEQRAEKHISICKNVENKPKAPPKTNSYGGTGTFGKTSYSGMATSSNRASNSSLTTSKQMGGSTSSKTNLGTGSRQTDSVGFKNTPISSNKGGVYSSQTLQSSTKTTGIKKPSYY